MKQKLGHTQISSKLPVLPELVPAASPRVLFPWVDGQIALGLSATTRDGPWPLFRDDLLDLRQFPESALGGAVARLRRFSSPTSWRMIEALPELRIYVCDDASAASRALLTRDLMTTTPFSGVIATLPSADQLMTLRLERVENVSML